MALNLAFLWHMHQPSYSDPRGEETVLPWVRLHATRGYYDMVWALERFPAMKATFNLVPVLNQQIHSYLDGDRDQYWRLSRKPARLLKPGERRFILENFFACSLDSCIRPRSRYYGLHQRARVNQDEPSSFSDGDLRDLQVLFNLAWFGFGARVEYPLIEELESKGCDFSEDDKRKLLDIQIAVLRRLFKTYEGLEKRGQVELTTTPFYHPILPLIIDTEAAERCQPDRARPQQFSWPSDAQLQVEKAMEYHETCFGRRPSGMWPAEGSVSPEAAALMTEAGIKWAATDEAILWNSLDSDSSGQGNERSALYQAFKFSPNGSESLDVIFRDHGLSDLIGFTYSRMDADSAVNDFVHKLEQIEASIDHADPLVVVALDGENPWEYYPQSGLLFLEALYARLTDHGSIKTVTVDGYLGSTDARGHLNRLHSASWIDGNYGVWIGGEEENSAWDLLGEARQAFEDRRHELDDETNSIVLEHLLRAQGSDWFWWYGERFDSGNDMAFDSLFRGQIEQAYIAMGVDVPSKVKTSLVKTIRPLTTEPPKHLISPDLTLARSTYFDWLGAGTLNLAESK